MTAEQTTPYVLVSELAADLNANVSNASVDPRTLARIVELSSKLTEWTGRRFDEYIDTLEYTAKSRARGGDLLSAHDLLLQADLKTLTALTNGDGTAIDLANVKLKPANTPYKRQIHLNTRSSAFFTAGGNDPEGAIAVSGTWGFRGQWKAGGRMLALAITDTTGVSITTDAALEAGMVIKVDTEQMYVESIVSVASTVTRAYNGTTAATHLINTPVYRWQSYDLVRRVMGRICAWASAQVKSPLFGQVVIGDLTLPVTIEAVPKDVQADIIRLGTKDGIAVV